MGATVNGLQYNVLRNTDLGSHLVISRVPQREGSGGWGLDEVGRVVHPYSKLDSLLLLLRIT
jgi:hypothetical protein